MDGIDVDKRRTLRRACIVTASFAAVWAYTVAITGGFAIETDLVRFSSRSPRRAVLLLIVASAAVWALDPKRLRWAADVGWLSAVAARVIPDVVKRHATPRLFAAVAALTMVLVGVVFGSHVVGGSDSYGYVSQANQWATGQLKRPQPLLNDLPEGVPQEALVPLGYRLSPDRGSLVPTYAPGLPMTMAVFERAGGRNAVYLVVPILAGLAVWATYAIGRLLIGELGGSIAAIFLATSPAFVFQLISAPMSDIAAAAWWNTALVLAWRSGRLPAFASGLATAAAILTRPNLVPLAIIPGLVFLTGLLSRNERSLAVQRLMLFGVPALVGCLSVASVNAYWYGSPLASGYGQLAGEFFQWGYFWPNVINYSRSILDTEGPLALLSLIGMVALWRGGRPGSEQRIARFCIGFFVAVYACYAFYWPIDVWWSVRFLFPAFPIFFILIVGGALAVTDRLGHGWRRMGIAVLVVAVTAHSISFIRSRNVFDSSAGEWRYETAGHYVGEHLPSRAAVFTMLHSGSVRHYSGRLTVRYDWITPEYFESMVMHLRQRGYVPYLLLDDAEEEDFRRRYAGTPVVQGLSKPQAKLPRVKLYELK
jgi:hypothetical protein